MFKTWKQKLEGYKPMKPIQVSIGPVMENVLEGIGLISRNFHLQNGTNRMEGNTLEPVAQS